MGKVSSISDFKQKKADEQMQEELAVAQQEFNEFIRLLRYFIEVQELQHNVLIVNRKDDKYIVTNEFGQTVTYGDDTDIKDLAEDLTNADDLLISLLISNKSKYLFINAVLDPELSRTITSVFDNAVFLQEVSICSL